LGGTVVQAGIQDAAGSAQTGRLTKDRDAVA
jgi:hypothetical protein